MSTHLLKSVLLKGTYVAMRLRTMDPGGAWWRPPFAIPVQATDEVIERVSEELQKVRITQVVLEESFHHSPNDEYEHATVSYLDANGVLVRGMRSHVTRKPEDQIKSDLTKPNNKPS